MFCFIGLNQLWSTFRVYCRQRQIWPGISWSWFIFIKYPGHLKIKQPHCMTDHSPRLSRATLFGVVILLPSYTVATQPPFLFLKCSILIIFHHRTLFQVKLQWHLAQLSYMKGFFMICLVISWYVVWMSYENWGHFLHFFFFLVLSFHNTFLTVHWSKTKGPLSRQLCQFQ